MSNKTGIPYGYTAERGTFPVYLENRHLLTFGPTRSGKGATVIIPALLQVPHSVLCIDPKGQNAIVVARRRREMGQDVHFLNPFNEHGLGTSRFNPLAHLRIDHPNVVADVASLAEALIYADGKESHWTDSARTLVRALLLYLIEQKGGEATLPEMRRLLTLPLDGPDGFETFRSVIAFIIAESAWPFVRQAAGRFLSDSREIQSIVSTAITQTDFLDDPCIAHVLGGHDFTMGQLKDRPSTVFLILPGRYLDAYNRFFRLLVTSAIDQLTSRPGGHPTLFVLDEFATLQNLASVSRAFGFAAGYRVQIWPFLQDLPQLKAIYGDRWESFLANAGLVQFFTPSDMTTAEYIERRSGKATVEKVSTTQSEISRAQSRQGFSGITTSISSELVALIPPELSMKMNHASQIVFFGGVQGPLIAGRMIYTEIPRLKGMWDADPFHS